MQGRWYEVNLRNVYYLTHLKTKKKNQKLNLFPIIFSLLLYCILEIVLYISEDVR